MRLKHVKNASEIISKCKYFICNPKDYISKWNKVFNNDNDIYIEIGCGKGKFIIENAIKNPNINFIGVEKYDSVLTYAVKKCNDLDINNLRFICIDALEIDEVFDREITKIFLTFSDPWPKKRHAKRRLTSNNFLKKYDLIFKNKCLIEMKTDNDDLFDYSIESFMNYGYSLVEENRDFFDNIRTEYEDKFILKGKNINHLIVKK